jgi:hypothetical protein
MGGEVLWLSRREAHKVFGVAHREPGVVETGGRPE